MDKHNVEMIKKDIYKKEKYIGYVGSLSGISGVFSSYQVCHSVCLGFIALLSIVGITLIGMPLLFLQKLALPLWLIALALFGLVIILYLKHKCIHKGLLIFNSGAIVIGVPFENFMQYRIYFLIAGIIIILFSLYLIIKDKLRK